MKRIVHKLSDIYIRQVLSLFPRDFGSELEGSAGKVTHTRPCGCVVTAEHLPKKHLWILTCDYSKCKRA